MNVRENAWSAEIQNSTPEQVKQDLIDQIPLGRLTAPEDVANAVAFFASLESNYINGAQLTVTGGMEA
jgi:3-oxoacyl-[acyl-carrier protein] reductase